MKTPRRILSPKFFKSPVSSRNASKFAVSPKRESAPYPALANQASLNTDINPIEDITYRNFSNQKQAVTEENEPKYGR